MSYIASIGTYLPPWQVGGSTASRRVKGPDEDALTMAVAAGRAADPAASAKRVVMVSRDFPLLEGGNGAVLLAGLSLPADITVSEVLGGAPAVLDQIVTAQHGTLIVAADDSDAVAGAGAVLVGRGGASVTAVARQNRSLPTVVRAQDGSRHDYADPRLERDIGVKATLARLELDGTTTVAAVAGVKASLLGRPRETEGAAEDSRVSGAAVIWVIAKAIEDSRAGLVLAVEQSSITAAHLSPGEAALNRDEFPPADLPKYRFTEGNGIPISLAAYARAFEPKLRWEAAIFKERPGIDANPQFPPRYRVESGGALADDYRLEALPRTGTVYTHTTIRIPVPDLPSPYSIAVVQLDGSPVRALMKVTGVPAGTAHIGDAGSVVLRRVAIRSGVPDYGYSFWPGRTREGVSA